VEPNDVFLYLMKRKGMVDALVVSGGEPTLQEGLVSFVKKAKETGVFVKLDTNGSRPEVLLELLRQELLDYVAMDIKAPFYKLEYISKGINIDHIKESIKIIMKHAPDYEFRTTVAPLLNKEDLLDISALIKGAKRYALQQYEKPKVDLIDARLDDKEHSAAFFADAKAAIEPFVRKVDVRGL